MDSRKRAAVALLVILCFSAITYGPDIAMPFVGDDYVFLDETRHRAFVELWAFENTAFRWYRPWSREVHFWALQHLVGLAPAGFRVAGLLLWAGAMALYMSLLRRMIPTSAAALAVIGVASLALWGTPLLWISGSQDLWMLVFSLLFLLLTSHRRDFVATAALSLALLSKETAGVLPLLGCAYIRMVQGASWTSAARRSAPAFGVTALWAMLHPALRNRILSPTPSDPESLHRPSHLLIGLKNVLATVNLSMLPKPSEVSAADVMRALIGAAVLCIGAWLVLREGESREAERLQPPRNGAVAFLATWSVIGWLPSHIPSIGWHAYYGCLGALGAWGLLALWLSRHRGLGIALLAGLTLLRAADAKTLTWDWGNEWYQRRAGSFLTAVEGRLKALHPTIQPHTRVFFGRLPNNIGLVAGQSAAVRVWYDDPTVTADFVSKYSRRSRPGVDLFFRFDTLRVLVEVKAGPSDSLEGFSENAEWESDHTKLAVLFLEAGEPARAADEFVKVSRLETAVQSTLYAAVSCKLAGEGSRSDSLLNAFARRAGLARTTVDSLAAEAHTRRAGCLEARGLSVALAG